VALSPARPGEGDPAPPRPRSWRPVLLSGLVLPGLGQLVSGHPTKGCVFALGSLAVIVALVRRVARETLVRLPTDPTEIDPLLPFRLAHEIHRDNASFFLWITLALVVLWAASIVDAWLSTSPRTRPGGRS
jgi:hypothetical protein